LRITAWGPDGRHDGTDPQLADVLDGDAVWRQSLMNGVGAIASFPLSGFFVD
jgi:hypothetical protein